jgi:hypothetical protein
VRVSKGILRASQLALLDETNKVVIGRPRSDPLRPAVTYR